jgi:putative sterol carrier protein
MSLEQITNGLRQRVGTDCGLGASVKFDFGPDGVVFLDATKVPNEVSNEDQPADCTMKIAMDDFIAMTQGELDGTTAFMMGKLKIEGDMSIAQRLQGVLRG